MTTLPNVRLSLVFIFALLGAPRVRAQVYAPAGLPEPRLRETPWGDFPFGRLLPGARLRLTATDGQRVERQLVAIGDSSIELLDRAGDSTLRLTLAELRRYRQVEVRALPSWSDRVGTGSAIGGALLGAITGTIVHNSRKPSSAAVHRRSRLDDIAGAATVGSLLGWEIGIHTLGLPRWRPVTLP